MAALWQSHGIETVAPYGASRGRGERPEALGDAQGWYGRAGRASGPRPGRRLAHPEVVEAPAKGRVHKMRTMPLIQRREYGVAVCGHIIRVWVRSSIPVGGFSGGSGVLARRAWRAWRSWRSLRSLRSLRSFRFRLGDARGAPLSVAVLLGSFWSLIRRSGDTVPRAVRDTVSVVDLGKGNGLGRVLEMLGTWSSSTAFFGGGAASAIECLAPAFLADI